MTDKERLEEIPYNIAMTNHSQVVIDANEYQFLYQYAIQQTERVQALERVDKQLKNNLSVYKGYYKNMIKINEDIVEENKKYRKLIKDMGQEIEVLTDVMSKLN